MALSIPEIFVTDGFVADAMDTMYGRRHFKNQNSY